ncbi:MAG: glutathione S-transferase [Myxococcales bacterium]|nr:glutathione S-transferase [Myxococcales bacterium]
MIVFSDRGCPYAHRVLALLAHLGVPFDHRQAMLGDKPPGIERYSARGSIPLLVDGELVLTESRVILSYLAEAYDFEGAFPGHLAHRTRHRLAMALVDDWLAPALFGQRDVPGARAREVLDALQQATVTPPHPSLLAFHVAPIWLRYRRLRPTSEITRAIEARTALCGWLDAVAALPAIERTAPDPLTHTEDLRRAIAAGLVRTDLQLPHSI